MNDCPYIICCKPECQKYFKNCNVYKILENLLNYQQRKVRINKRIHRSEHGHKQYEEPPNFSDNVDIGLIVNSMMEV